MLREVARVLADDLNKRVIIVDTSNEIAGDGDIPHPAIGKARRMQVASPTLQ
ncbi:MAG: single-stranded DNA-binding protein, partial [Acidobacteria bacterium]|nr:single-stranded DNA-binding protein [Acidobacteriota bacterium]NIO60774.1 single-stranded DNA-binding protein [Acidobacteriota bacterium]NIQ31851.1 single-stranded DNA-binding protein [Acidobacteriota bacterium]